MTRAVAEVVRRLADAVLIADAHGDIVFHARASSRAQRQPVAVRVTEPGDTAAVR